MRRFLVATTVLAIAACAIDRTLTSPFTQSQNPLHIVGSCSLDVSHTLKNLGAQWPCGASVGVWVQGSAPAEFTASDSARKIWDNYVLGTYGLPAFSAATTTQPSGHYMIVVFNDAAGSSYYCGGSTGAGDGFAAEIDGMPDNNPNHCPLADGPSVEIASPSTLPLLIAHEMGHVMGFSHMSSKPTDYTCEMTLGLNPGFAPKPCELERQMLYWNYSLRASEVPDPDTFSLGLGQATVSLSPSSGNILPGSQLTVSATISTGDYTLTPSLQWTSNGALAINSSSNIGAVIHGTGAGSGTLTATVVDDSLIIWPTAPGSGTYTTNVPPPSALTVSNITSSSATLGWTLGTTGVTTTVQDRVSGTSTWSTIGTTTTNGASYPLTGLVSCTGYDVNLYSTLNGQTSAGYATTNAFATGVCAPSSFTIDGICSHRTIGGRDYTYVPVGWGQTQSGAPGWDIASNSSNDTTTLSVIASGTEPPDSTTVGPFPSYSGAHPTYVWIRQTSGGQHSQWVANDANPIVVVGGC